MWEARCVRSSCTWNLVWCAQLSKCEVNQVLWAFEDAVFHLRIACIQHPTYGSLRCRGMLSVMVPPISTLKAITTMKSMPSSARGGLASAIKLKFKFWLVIGEECDREGNAYSLTHANGCNKQPAASPPRVGARQAMSLWSQCLQVYFTTLLRSGSYLIGSSFKGKEKDNLVLSASLRSQYFMKQSLIFSTRLRVMLWGHHEYAENIPWIFLRVWWM